MWWWNDQYSGLPAELAQQQFQLEFPDFDAFQQSWMTSTPPYTRGQKAHQGFAEPYLQQLFDVFTGTDTTIWDAMRNSQSYLQPDIMRMGA